MFVKKSWIALVVCALLLLSSCARKSQDLVDKAFEGKNFDRALPKQDQEPPKQPEEEDEDDGKTKSSVLVDKIQPVQEDTVYMKTGSAERPEDHAFEKDPVAPAFNFDEVKIYEVIRALCDLMNLNYIIDPAVQDQAITIRIAESDNKFKASELLDLILKLHDLTMVVHESYVHIVPISSPEVNPGLELLYGTKPNENLLKEELIIQLIPLKYITPSEMTTIAKEFLSPSARILEESKNNILIIIDKQQFIAKVLELAPIFDVDALHNKKMVFYQLAHVDAVDTAGKLQEIMTMYGYEAEGERLALMPIETLNGILAVSTRADIFKELDFWIAKFDQEAQYEEDQVFVYQVQNTTAYNLAYMLSQLFGLEAPLGGGQGVNNISQRRTTDPNLNPRGGTTGNNFNQPGGSQPQFRNQQNPPAQPPARPSTRNRFSSSDDEEENAPKMIVDEENNSLIFMTTPREYARMHKTLEKLDILPRQVFLEVTVLSVQLNDEFEFGIDWSADSQFEAGAVDSRSIEYTATGNLSAAYNIVNATRLVTARVNALKKKGYVNVLQQPHIMAIDNQQASISVGTDVPITTTTTNIDRIVGGQGDNPATSSTVQYRQTGVTLGFTPHINANGVIRMEISLDISSAGAQSGTEAVPISQNALQTEMIVRDDQTVVMGGLILDSENWGRNTVPFFGRIPLLKHLFNQRNSTVTKSELIVMITPRLIDSEEKSIAISKEFREKILKEFESFKKLSEQ